MWRSGSRVWALVLVLCVPAVCTAQGLLPFQGMGVCNVGGVQVVPSLKVGYQNMVANMTLPVPLAPTVNLYPLDVKLQDANVWIGGVRVDARLGGVSLFLSGEGNASRSVSVSTPSVPSPAPATINWRGTRFQWWSVGGGGAFDICSNFAVVGGVKAEQWSLGLSDPEDQSGLLNQFLVNFLPSGYSADLLTRLWVPYFGLRVDGHNFTSTFIFSPYTWANVQIPLSLFANIPVPEVGGWQYSFKRGGISFEGTLDYRVQASANAGCNLWFKGSWCSIRGSGSENFHGQIDNLLSFNNSAEASGTFTSYVLAGGLSFLYAF
jgi:hypothetical protein